VAHQSKIVSIFYDFCDFLILRKDLCIPLVWLPFNYEIRGRSRLIKIAMQKYLCFVCWGKRQFWICLHMACK